MKRFHKYNLGILVLSAFLLANSALAFEVTSLPETPVKDDFLVSPARTEIVMSPGDKIVKYITILNRFGSDYNFTVAVEDFSPSKDSGNPVLSETTADTGAFSLKNYVKPDAKSFFLKQGSRAKVAVTISVPKNVPPGGRYAAILISASPRQKSASATTIISRIGSLLLVKVDGVVEENGQLSNFVFKDGGFWISYKNEGNIHLDPYGVIEIKSAIGGPASGWKEAGNLVETVQIDPWIILPGSTRSRPLTLSGELPDGKYVAKIMLNRGYKDIVDSKELSFRLGPIPISSEIPEADVDFNIWYYIIILAVGLVVLFGVRFMRKK